MKVKGVYRALLRMGYYEHQGGDHRILEMGGKRVTLSTNINRPLSRVERTNIERTVGMRIPELLRWKEPKEKVSYPLMEQEPLAQVVATVEPKQKMQAGDMVEHRRRLQLLWDAYRAGGSPTNVPGDLRTWAQGYTTYRIFATDFKNQSVDALVEKVRAHLNRKSEWGGRRDGPVTTTVRPELQDPMASIPDFLKEALEDYRKSYHAVIDGISRYIRENERARRKYARLEAILKEVEEIK